MKTFHEAFRQSIDCTNGTVIIDEARYEQIQREAVKDLASELAEANRKLADVEKERDKAKQSCLDWALGVKQSNTDIVDMQRDEFRRIIALTDNTEIKGICERAIACIEQTVPVVVQRDEANNKVRLMELQVQEMLGREKYHREYEELLVDELEETVGIAYVHGWRSKRHHEGMAYRKILGIPERGPNERFPEN